MAKKPYILRDLPLWVFACALVLVAYTWQKSGSMKQSYMQKVRSDLMARAKLTRAVMPYLNIPLQQKCDRLSNLGSCRATIIKADGEVLADSSALAAQMANHLDRPEVAAAARGKSAVEIRYSNTLGKHFMYVALPVSIRGQGKGILRLASSISGIYQVLDEARSDIIFAVLIATIFTALISLILIRRVNLPIARIRASAARISEGDLDSRIPVPEKGAVRDLALAINNMAEQLKYRLKQSTSQKNERDTILSSMTEGVVALNSSGEIISANKAAKRLLQLPDELKGKPLWRLVQNRELIDVIEKILAENNNLELRFVMSSGENKRHLRLKASPLHDASDSKCGALLVFADITEIKKLEAFRRDFIANVSHEIKTPLTAIYGAVEALNDGALNSKKDTRRFVGILERHASRLKVLVDDILSLSAIEREEFKEEFECEAAALKDVIGTAAAICREKALAKNVKLKIVNVDDVVLKIDAPLMEQALINLIDNAVKYTEGGGAVEISAKTKDNQVFIDVKDNGIGIKAKHHARLFERFYRVDKARSRALGGTGLGLAIVKHIVSLHRGNIAIKSSEGEGSTFTITLPLQS